MKRVQVGVLAIFKASFSEHNLPTRSKQSIPRLVCFCISNLIYFCFRSVHKFSLDAKLLALRTFKKARFYSFLFQNYFVSK